MKRKKNEFGRELPSGRDLPNGRDLPKCLCHYFMLYTSHVVGLLLACVRDWV